MNLAELIINTIEDEGKKTRQHLDSIKLEILSSIGESENRVFLEQEVEAAFSKAPKVAVEKSKLPTKTFSGRAKNKAPHGGFDEIDMNDWVSYNFELCTKILQCYRQMMTANQVAKSVNKHFSYKKYSQASIYNIWSTLKKFGYVDDTNHLPCATDKLRECKK